MRTYLRLLAVFLLLGLPSPVVGQTIYDGPTVETPELRVELRPQDEGRFVIYLTDKMTGRQVQYEFHEEGANDPEPFLMVESRYCNTSVLLLTIEFPWRHSLPQYSRLLDTYAFHSKELAYIDMTIGSVTDIALLDSFQIEAEDMLMQLPIFVECLSDLTGSPFRFKKKSNN